MNLQSANTGIVDKQPDVTKATRNSRDRRNFRRNNQCSSLLCPNRNKTLTDIRRSFYLFLLRLNYRVRSCILDLPVFVVIWLIDRSFVLLFLFHSVIDRPLIVMSPDVK